MHSITNNGNEVNLRYCMFQKKNNGNHKRLEKVDWSIVGRILGVLYNGGSMTKTKLSMKCQLNSKQTRLYLDLLKGLEMIETESFADSKRSVMIRLTRWGRSYYENEIIETHNVILEKEEELVH